MNPYTVSVNLLKKIARIQDFYFIYKQGTTLRNFCELSDLKFHLPHLKNDKYIILSSYLFEFFTYVMSINKVMI